MEETELVELGNEYEHLKQRYGRKVRTHVHTFAPLDDEKFWELLGKLHKDLQYKKLKDSKHGCEEFVRSLCWPAGMSGWVLASRFLATYTKLVSRLHKKLRDLKGLERGDDGFGDLCDSLPIAGGVVIGKVLSDDILSFKQLEEAVPDEALRKFTLHGENYIRMSIETSLVEKYSHLVARYSENE